MPNLEDSKKSYSISLKKRYIEFSKKFGIKLDKAHGQCLLIDENIANFIVELCDLNASDQIIEIGPGFGVLTQKITPKVSKIFLMEMDRRMIEALHTILQIDDAQSNLQGPQKLENKKINFIPGDAIKNPFPLTNKLVSNVPYQISGPLFQKIVLEGSSIEKIILMLQKEFVDRLMSEPDPKRYSRLSVMGQIFFIISREKLIDPSVFFPRPKVDSAIISMKQNPEFAGTFSEQKKRKQFIEMLSGIFPHKGKTISKAIELFIERWIKQPEMFPILNENYLIENLIDNDIKKELKEKVRLRFGPKRVWQLDPSEYVDLFTLITSSQCLLLS